MSDFTKLTKREKYKVSTQYEAIRRSNRHNMIMMFEVQRTAYDNDFHELVNCIQNDMKHYSELLYHVRDIELDDTDIPELTD